MMAHPVELRARLVACSDLTAKPGFASESLSGMHATHRLEEITFFAGSFQDTRSGDEVTSFIRRILETGREDLLEHPSATIYLDGISHGSLRIVEAHKNLTVSAPREAITDRGEGPEVVLPDLPKTGEDVVRIYLQAIDDACFTYREILAAVEDELQDAEPNRLARQHRAFDAAATLLPDAMATQAVMTGNLRHWRHFIARFAARYEKPELRRIALACLNLLAPVAPTVFSDFEVQEFSDGSKAAQSCYL